MALSNDDIADTLKAENKLFITPVPGITCMMAGEGYVRCRMFECAARAKSLCHAEWKLSHP